MGGFGFGQGFFGQYAVGGTTPVVFVFGPMETTTVESADPTYTVESNDTDRTLADGNRAYTVEFNG